MPASSLVSLCTKACIKYIRSLNDVGDFEYWKIRNVLSRITSPDQLHEIELASPQIRGEDAELWKAFIARDIPNWKLKNYAPKNPLNWYKVYVKYKKEQHEEVERDKEKLRAAMLGIQKHKETHVSKVVDSKHLPKPPRDPRMLANDGGVPIAGRKKGFAKPASSVLSWNAGSKTKMKDGASVLTRARREAKELSSRNKLGMPTHQLQSKASQVLQAPKGMVNEYRKAAEPPLRIYTPRRKLSGVSSSDGPANGTLLEERERRLRAMKMATHTADVTLVGSDSDEDPDEEADNLFDEKEASTTLIIVRKPHSKQETRFMPSSATVKPLGTSQTIANPKSLPTKLLPIPKASDVISSIISRPKPQQPAEQPASLPSKLAPSEHHSSSPSRERSPLRGLPRPPKRKKEVDIFNRGGSATKKPRAK